MTRDNDKQNSISIDISKFLSSKDLIEKNNARYILGSFVSRSRIMKTGKREKHDQDNSQFVKLFSKIIISKETESKTDYNVTLDFDSYDDSFKVQSEGHTTNIDKINAKCFMVKMKFENPNNKDDAYIFLSNGCPGIYDPRLVASRIIGVMMDKLWLVDSASTELIQMNGANPNSWFSSFETDPEVDKLFGY